MKKEKTPRKIVIDLDCGNTVEDNLALCYAFADSSLDVQAITLAPFKYKGLTLKDTQLENELEAHRVMRYIGFKDYDICFEGSCGFCDELYTHTSPAVDKIIELASHANTTIVCLGSLTNVAIAIEKKPSIAKNLNILWLGLRHIFHQEFTDVNYITDRRAFEIVAKSTASLTVFPSYTGKLFAITYEKIKEDVAVNQLGNYLYKRLTENIDFRDEFCRMYSLLPVAYLIDPDVCYVKRLPVNLLLKDFTKTSMNKLVNYVYDLKSIEGVWKDFSKKLIRLSNNFAPTNYFFISDTHFNDPRKYKIKQFGFKTKEEMTETLVKNWNSVVSKKDIVYHLGDFGDYNVIKRLNGKVYLICGNHDKLEKDESFEQFRQKLKNLGFADVYKDGIMLDKKIFGIDVYMNHYPSKTKPNMVNFFGHVHSLKPIKRMGINVAANYHKGMPISRKDMQFFIKFVTTDNWGDDNFAD